ncbi:autotransporter domain-containing protein [Hyphobacterium sp. HN65]|uniref:Autotransporter domain-containing protein n=1 Tax=Hyphobacterium lacteum TaxID=3116575 RepID=A0ABU7LLP0_9PROT|nr:autotransporter domain-containing protein [Hyphobacterium sp. HN65]MEE2524845.1 autotransporter domain-containing protein [Hyphobacterium sp. HN65]
MRNRLLITTAFCAAFLSAPALAQTEITDERTTGIRTSTINDGQPANIIISSTGRVAITTDNGGTGPAVTVDSDNDLTNNGEITDTTGGNNVVAVMVNGGTTGTVTNNGTISVAGTNVGTDTDGDGDGDGPFTDGENRVGILVDGTGAFTGSVINGENGSIDVAGNNSAAIRTVVLVDGSLLNSGFINVLGDNSYGIDVQGGLTGDLNIGGTVNATGQNASAVRVGSNIDGIFLLTGNIQTTGYRITSTPNDTNIINVDADDRLLSSSAIQIGGNLGRGFYIAGTAFSGSQSPGQILARTTAPAIWIAPSLGTGENIVLSRIMIPADPDTEGSTDTNFDFSFVNEGFVQSVGVFNGNDSTAVRIEGAMVGGMLRTTTLEGGFLNAGTISAQARQANAVAVVLGNGAIVPVFENSGTLNVSTFGPGSDGLGVHILSGANVPIFRNSNFINVTTTGPNSSTGILDESNSLALIENTGVIFAVIGNGSSVFPVDYGTDIGASGEVSIVNRTAIDVSASTIDVTLRQMAPPADSPNSDAVIRGDVRLGSGNDTVDIQAGFVDGDIYFGDGADTLTVSNGAAIIGSLHDSDGQLSLTVNEGQIELQNETPVQLTQATFNDGSRLIFEVNSLGNTSAFIDASGTVTFNEGSTITASLDGLIGEGAEFIVLTANDLVINTAIDALQDTDAPYLYNTSIARDPNDANQLVLTLRRKTSGELGMHENRAAAYEAAFSAWQDNDALGSAFAALNNSADFFSAYDQLLPEYAASAIQFAVASNDSAIGALSGRLDAARRSPDGTGGVWLQEFGYFADRSQSSFGPGYRGQGVGIAAGVDRPFGPLYALGLNFVGAASDIEEANGVDEPMTALTAQVGVYGGADFGDVFSGEFYLGGGFDSFETERRVLIGSFDRTAMADWTGYHYSGSARFSRDFEIGRWYARPSLSIDYLRLFESAFSESGGGQGIDLIIDDRESSTFSSTASFTAGARFGSSNSWWSPQVRIGYRNDFGGQDAITTARFSGYTNEFSFRAEDLPGSGLILGLALQAGSNYSTFSFDYDADLRDGFVRHTARLVVRLVF